jgi:hypothetical protein
VTSYLSFAVVLSFKCHIEREKRRSCLNKQFYVSYTQKQGILIVKSKVTAMNDRLKILGVFAVLGFIGGVLANIAYRTVWPWL